MDQSILTKKEYGKISLRLGTLMDGRGISRNRLAKAIDTRFEVVDKWYQGDMERIDMDVLARICFVLECQVEDILVYEPAQPEQSND